jgi:transcriptional regulator with XRE-family HTH domain
MLILAMSINTKVAKNILKHIKKRGTTQEKLAYEIGISKGYLSNFLRGNTGMSLTTLQKVATGLHVTVKDLMP